MLCSICHKKPAAKGQGRCAECHATYFRGYRKSAQQKRDQKTFLMGVLALRNALITTFRTVGAGEMSGYTAVEIVKNCKPDVPPKTVAQPNGPITGDGLDALIQEDIAQNPQMRAKAKSRRYVTVESLRR